MFFSDEIGTGNINLIRWLWAWFSVDVVVVIVVVVCVDDTDDVYHGVDCDAGKC